MTAEQLRADLHAEADKAKELIRGDLAMDVDADHSRAQLKEEQEGERHEHHEELVEQLKELDADAKANGLEDHLHHGEADFM